MREHPLRAVKEELQMHGHREEMAVGLLSKAAVGEYLAARFAVGAHGRAPWQGLARLIHQRTDGNPLFMINVGDYWVRQGSIVQRDGQWELKVGVEEVEGGVPESLRQMIEKQIEQLSPKDQRVLEVGSVAGAEFSAAAVAAGLGAEVGEVEEQCAGLARRDPISPLIIFDV
jgi:predicted ATPase